MLNFGAKFLLVATSLSPVLGAVAVNQIEHGKPWTSWLWWLAAGFILTFLCWILLRYAAKNAQKHLLYIKEFERRDQEMLAFLFTYLLPFVQSESIAFAGGWFTSLYILGIITLVIAHAGAFHFNPVMRLFFRYRFYAVKNCKGMSYLLISKKDLRRPRQEIQTVQISPDVYLHIGDTDA